MPRNMHVQLTENSRRCSYENCFETANLAVIPVNKRYQILKQFKLFIPKNARMCPFHKATEDWYQCSLSAHANFTTIQLKEMSILLDRIPTKKISHSKVTANENETGLSNVQFLELFNSLPTFREMFRNEEKGKLALKMYLMRLRTGDTLIRLRNHFSVSEKTQ